MAETARTIDAPGQPAGDGAEIPLVPELAALVAGAVAAGRPALSAGTPEDGRRMLARLRAAFGRGPAVDDVQEHSIPGQGGSIPARLFAPPDPSGLAVYFHGGGWVLGTPDDFDAVARVLAVRSGCAVLLVDYRLAPEARFPAAVEDALDTVRWAHATWPGRRLVVAGDSAGGNLAAVAAAELHRQVPIAGQVLVYPVTDGDMDTPSYQRFGGPGLLSRADMAWFFGLYAPGAARDDGRLYPAARTDLAGQPPAYVATAGVDVLRDEGEAYALALRSAGVPTILRRFEGLPHGFIRLHNLSPAADAAVSEIAAAIAALCGAATLGDAA